MLSQENIEKINMRGLYKHEPDRKYSRHNDLYWCQNWTFTPKKSERDGIVKYYMVDTYWSSGDGLCIELNNDNISEFNLIFDFDCVKAHNGNNIYDYNEEDYYHVAIDSGGMYCGGKYFINKDAIKNKEKVLNRLENEIESVKKDLEWKISNYEQVKSGERNIEYV